MVIGQKCETIPPPGIIGEVGARVVSCNGGSCGVGMPRIPVLGARASLLSRGLLLF